MGLVLCIPPKVSGVLLEMNAPPTQSPNELDCYFCIGVFTYCRSYSQSRYTPLIMILVPLLGSVCLFLLGVSSLRYYCRLSPLMGTPCLWSNLAFKNHFNAHGYFCCSERILFWASGHRTHHRHVDDIDQDPYSINPRFLVSRHIGWMLRDYPASEPNYKNAPGFIKQIKLVLFQDKYYIPLVIAVHAGDFIANRLGCWRHVGRSTWVA